jgi:hypothetical protein
MRKLLTGFLFLVVVGLLALPSVAQSARPTPCPELLFPDGACALDVGAALEQCCPCDNARFRNHGQFVKCRVHAVNALRRAGCLDRDARRSLKRCAARSTCGRPGFVTCCVEREGICEGGVCLDDPNNTQCESSEICPPRPKCRIKRDAATCRARSGVAGTGSCCDVDQCTPTAGALKVQTRAE